MDKEEVEEVVEEVEDTQALSQDEDCEGFDEEGEE